MIPELLAVLALSAIPFIIAVYITRAIFSIGTIVKNLEAQTELLRLLALDKDGNKEKVDKILAETVNR